MNIRYIEFWAKQYARESVYYEIEIKWLMDVLNKRYKNKERVLKETKSMLMICANNDVGTLYQLYQTFVDTGIVIPVDVRRKTFCPLNYYKC